MAARLCLNSTRAVSGPLKIIHPIPFNFFFSLLTKQAPLFYPGACPTSFFLNVCPFLSSKYIRWWLDPWDFWGFFWDAKNSWRKTRGWSGSSSWSFWMDLKRIQTVGEKIKYILYSIEIGHAYWKVENWATIRIFSIEHDTQYTVHTALECPEGEKCIIDFSRTQKLSSPLLFQFSRYPVDDTTIFQLHFNVH